MSKTAPLELKPVEIAGCPECKGSGQWAGMFHRGPCARCRGAGVVRATDLAPLDPDEMGPAMREALRRARSQLRRVLSIDGVREAIAKDRERRTQEAIYPPGRYHGD